MARITTNTAGTQPVVEIATAVSGNITIPCLQDITITNSTGVYTYTCFDEADVRKLSTPADNEISMNIVIDPETYFGNSTATANSAAYFGIATLSTDKVAINFTIYWAGNTAAATDYVTTGSGFISGLAPTTSPEAPVWVTPITIAVDGSLTNTQQ